MKDKTQIKEKKVSTLKYRFLIFISFALLLIMFGLMNIFLLSNNFDGISNNGVGLFLNEGSSLFLTKYVGGNYIINTKGYITIIGFILSFIVSVGTIVAYNGKKIIIGKSKYALTIILTILIIINSLIFALMILITPFKSGNDLLNALLIPKNDNFGLFQINESNLINFNEIQKVNFGWIAILRSSNNSVRFIAGNMYFTLVGFSIMALLIYLFSFVRILFMVIFARNHSDNSKI